MAYVENHDTLDASEEWASPAQMANNSDRIAGIVRSDVGGTLTVEQGYPEFIGGAINWVATGEAVVVADEGGDGWFSVTCVAPKWRLRFVNGDDDQTEFEVHARNTAAGTNG